jgi:hypothetical protein
MTRADHSEDRKGPDWTRSRVHLRRERARLRAHGLRDLPPTGQ